MNLAEPISLLSRDHALMQRLIQQNKVSGSIGIIEVVVADARMTTQCYEWPILPGAERQT